VAITKSSDFAPAVSKALSEPGRTIIYVSAYPKGDMELSDTLQSECGSDGSGGGVRLASGSNGDETTGHVRALRVMHNSYK
jgi:hypothetical protein